MSTRDSRTPEEEGSYADSELPVDATIPKDDDRLDGDDRLDDDRLDRGKGGFENATDDVVGKVKEGLGKVTGNERLEAEGEAQQADADPDRARRGVDERY